MCAIGRDGDGECLLLSELKLLAGVINALPGSSGGARVDEKALRAMLFTKTACSTEQCVVDAIEKKVVGTPYEASLEKIRLIAFRADGPKDLSALLDSFLLIRMCVQIAANHPRVNFGGILTCDFMIPPITSKFGTPSAVVASWKERAWDQLHFVLNLDHRMGAGQHWLAVCVDIPRDTEKGSVEYFDSYGMPPSSGLIQGSRPWPQLTDSSGRFLSRVDEWLIEVRKAFQAAGVGLQLKINETDHQSAKDFSNCGVYATYYLLSRAQRIPFETINSRAISTAEITKQRDALYHRTDEYEPSLPNQLVGKI